MRPGLSDKGGTGAGHACSHEKQQRAASRTTHPQWNDLERVGVGRHVALQNCEFVPEEQCRRV